MNKTYIGESLEIHQNLLHLFDQHLFEVLVPPHELDEDLLVPGLSPVDVEGILEDAGPGRGRFVSSLILVGAARSEKAPGYENFKENFTVATIVELVTRCVKELEHSIEVHADLRTKRKCWTKIFNNLTDSPRFLLYQNPLGQFWRDPQ